MNKNFTQEQWFREKLSETATPPWREGWESMSHLLDEAHDLPPVIYPFQWKKWLAAAAIALLAGLSLWWVWPQPNVRGIIVSTQATNNIPGEVKQRTKITEITTPVFPPTVSSIDNKVVAVKALPVTKFKAPSPLPILQKADKHLAVAIIKNISPVPLKLKKGQYLASASTIKYTSIEIPPATKDKLEVTDNPVRQWHISLKLNANNGAFVGDASANFNPLLKGAPVEVYPSVYISKGLSQRFSLQTGIAFVSPVDIRHQDLNRTVPDPVRAMAANVSASEDNMQLSRLYYMDIPLTMQYHLNKKLSLNSGLQVSVLEKVIGQKQRLDYDQYGTLALADPQTPQPENLTGTTSAKDIVNPVDVRGVIGLQYRPAERWSTTIQFQYGLTDISKNRTFLNDHTNRNTVLKASIGFLIR